MAKHDVTGLLARWQQGRHDAINHVIGAVHEELSRIAHRLMQSERCDHTFQTADLVNEAYLRLLELKQIHWQDRSHFFAVAANVMRRVLVDQARAGSALKRGGDMLRVTLDESFPQVENDVDLLALDMALKRLNAHDELQSRIVEMRYFAGLTVAQIAEAIGISPATVKRKWTFAQAWLYRELCAGEAKA